MSHYQTLKTRKLRTGMGMLQCYFSQQQLDFIAKFSYRMGCSKTEVVRRAMNVFMFQDRRLIKLKPEVPK